MKTVLERLDEAKAHLGKLRTAQTLTCLIEAIEMLVEEAQKAPKADKAPAKRTTARKRAPAKKPATRKQSVAIKLTGDEG